MPRKFSEERTRKEMIDPQLERAGWYLHDHWKAIAAGWQNYNYITHHNFNSDQIRFCTPCNACSRRNAISKLMTCMMRLR